MNECRGGRDEHGNFIVANGTALHWAAYYGQLEIAKLLIEKGAGMCLHNCNFAWVHPSAGKQLIESCLTEMDIAISKVGQRLLWCFALRAKSTPEKSQTAVTGT